MNSLTNVFSIPSERRKGRLNALAIGSLEVNSEEEQNFLTLIELIDSFLPLIFELASAI